MSLQDEYFNLIANGKKTVEIRLNDEKRKLIKKGDRIEFVNLKDLRKIAVGVINIMKYKSFDEMYKNIEIDKIGMGELSLSDFKEITYCIYSKEEEKKYGVIAISISLVLWIYELTGKQVDVTINSIIKRGDFKCKI